MPQKKFEVGDHVALPSLRCYGHIVAVKYEEPRTGPALDIVRNYTVQLSDGVILTDVYEGLEYVLQ